MKTFESVTALYKLDQIEVDESIKTEGKPNAFTPQGGDNIQSAGNVISVHQVSGAGSEKSAFPTESKLLIGAIGVAWLMIISYVVIEHKKRKSN